MHPTNQTYPAIAIGPRRVGGEYYCDYWNQTYKVLEIRIDSAGWAWSITVRWSDGQQTTHCTGWDWKRDKVLPLADAGEVLTPIGRYGKIRA